MGLKAVELQVVVMWQEAGVRCLAVIACLSLALLSGVKAAEVDDRFVAAHTKQVSALLNGVDLNRSGLERVRSAERAGDLTQATQLLLDYFKQRQVPSAILELASIPPWPLGETEREIMAGTFTFQQVKGTNRRRADGGLDWKDTGPRRDREWTLILHRHQWMRPLVGAWLTTGESGLIAFVDEQLRDWIKQHPYPKRPTASPPWRPLEVARRVEMVWLGVLLQLWHHPEMSDQTRVLMLASLLDHADSLRRFHSLGGNHRITEWAILAKLALCFPELREASAWLEEAYLEICTMLEEQTYPDGSYKELANHYQRIAAESFLTYYRLLLAADRNDQAQRVRPRLEAMWDYLARVRKPDGSGPLNNDSDLDGNLFHLGRIERVFDRPDWLAEPRSQPPHTSLVSFYPWAGHAVMRSGWDAQARWAFFDMGPQGTDHDHDDRLHLSLAVGAAEFLVDTGRYTYEPGAWRRYFTGAHGHNVVMRNGRPSVTPPPQVERPLPIEARIDTLIPEFAAQVRFAPEGLSGGAVHRRAVTFYPDQGWVVTDRVIGFGAHRVETAWHFHPEVTVQPVGMDLLAKHQNGTTLLMRPEVRAGNLPWRADYSIVRGRGRPEPLGWYAAQFNVREAASRVTHVWKGWGVVEILWFISDCGEEGVNAMKSRHFSQLPRGRS